MNFGRQVNVLVDFQECLYGHNIPAVSYITSSLLLHLTLYLLVSSADNFCKQFGSR